MKIGTALINATQMLSQFSTARLDAELLLAHVLKLTRTQLIAVMSDELAENNLELFMQFIVRRQQSEPVEYIIGYKEFWGLKFKVNNSVLIPRPETELMIEKALDFLSTKTAAKILELGTGSGCIAITLAHEAHKRNWKLDITTLDLSDSALEVAKENAESILSQNQIKFLKSNWFSELDSQKYDLILSNPPYVDQNSSDIYAGAKFEPASALFAEQQGFADLKKIIDSADKYLAEDARLMLEFGRRQHIEIEAYAKANYNLQFYKDLAGIERLVVLEKK